MLATDPLSLVFLGCVIFSGAFLLISMSTGIGHGHLHLGHLGHLGHTGDVGHVSHMGHVAHPSASAHQIGHTAAGHTATGATTDASGAAPSGATSTIHSVLSPVQDTLEGALNPLSALSFLFIFGLVGYLLHNAARAGVVLSILIPALLGLCVAAAVGAGLARLFASADGELTVETTRPEGRIGTVSMAIRADGVGEVIFARAGAGRQSIGATSATGEPITAGTEVVILALRDGIARVETWDVFMRELRAGRTPTLEAIEPAP
jgi:hypothetical protein